MKKLLLFLIAVFTVCSVNAQELRMPKYKFTDNWSVSVGVGGNMTFADEYESIKPQNWGPEAWISLNKDWSPVFGTRLNLGWGQNNVLTFNEGLEHIVPELLNNLALRPNRLDAGLDFTFNPINLFNYNYDRRLNVLTVVGLGYSHTFEKNYSSDQIANANYFEVEGLKKGNYLVPKVGIQLNYRVSDPVLIFIEGDFKVYSDKLDNIVNTAQYDGNLVLTAGITYRFKNHDGTRGFNYIPSYDQEDIDALNNEINNLREQLDKKPKEVMVIDTVTVTKESINNISTPMTIRFVADSYNIDDAQLANLDNLALFLKDNPNVKVSIVGYADEETGTPEYNQQLSEKRAEAVKSVLVNDYGIDPSRLIVSAEGDKVQQYDKNSWNRAVIITNN